VTNSPPSRTSWDRAEDPFGEDIIFILDSVVATAADAATLVLTGEITLTDASTKEGELFFLQLQISAMKDLLTALLKIRVEGTP
jgi:predicted metal-dependent TIM-barrel fold hydrolase